MMNWSLGDRSVLVTALFFLLITDGYAGWEIHSDFRMRMDSSQIVPVVDDIWYDLNENYNENLPNLSVSNPYRVNITGINANIQYSIGKPTKLEALNLWEFQTNDVEVRLNIARLDASQKVIRQIGDATIEIEVSANCSSIPVTLPSGKASVVAAVKADVQNGKIHLTNESLEINWPEDAWEIGSFSCSGASDLEGVVRAEAKKAINSSRELVHNRLKEKLAQELVSFADEIDDKIKMPLELVTGTNQFTIEFQPEKVTDVGEDIAVAEGKMLVKFPNIETEQDIIQVIEFENQNFDDTEGASLVVPFQTIKAIAKGMYFAGMLQDLIYEKDLPLFTQFRSSWWAVFFTWPDLNYFYLAQKFAFKVYTTAPMQLGDASKDQTGRYQLKMPIQVPLAIQSYAPVQGNLYKYLTFLANIRGNSFFKVNNGKLAVRLTANQLKVSGYWNRGYLNSIPRTNTYVNAQLLGSEIAKNMAEQDLSFSLPRWNVGENMQFIVDKMRPEGKNVRLFWTLEKLTKENE